MSDLAEIGDGLARDRHRAGRRRGPADVRTADTPRATCTERHDAVRTGIGRPRRSPFVRRACWKCLICHALGMPVVVRVRMPGNGFRVSYPGRPAGGSRHCTTATRREMSGRRSAPGPRTTIMPRLSGSSLRRLYVNFVTVCPAACPDRPPKTPPRLDRQPPVKQGERDFSRSVAHARHGDATNADSVMFAPHPGNMLPGQPPASGHLSAPGLVGKS